MIIIICRILRHRQTTWRPKAKWELS